jgi:ABC-type lipoprotein release transport system permease subunit
MKTKWLIFIIFSIFIGLLSSLTLPHSRAQLPNNRLISGIVLDNITSQPIVNARVSVWTYQRLVETVITNDSGRFALEVNREIPYQIYIYYDDLDSPGFDYIPVIKELHPSRGNVTLSIRLLPAASILFSGNFWFVESTNPFETYTFTVTGLNLSPSNYGYVNTFGTSPPTHNFLNLSSKHMIVPLDATFQIAVNASILVSGKKIYKFFVVNDFESINLTKGQLIQVGLDKYTSLVNYEFTEDQINATSHLLSQLEKKGFYLIVEKEDLINAASLLEQARVKRSKIQYSKAYIDLKEAYITNVALVQRLESIYTNAVGSVYVLTFFLVLTSLAISLLLYEHIFQKLATYPLFFSALFSIFYYTYPGCLLIPFQSLLTFIFISLILGAFLMFITPLIVKEKIISTFSLAKRNLRRRKTRFILTLITVITLVTSFVSFTSFSTGYGFTTKQHSYLPSDLSEGLYIQHPQPSDPQATFYFIPLEPSLIELLKEHPEIHQLAPKAENQPQLSPLAFLNTSSSSQHIPIHGAIGIQPSAEAEILKIDNLITGGRYLRDEDENVILISDDLAKEKGIEINSQIILIYGASFQVTVIGLFDARRLLQIKDINGEGLLPSKLMLGERSSLEKTRCKPNEIIIMPFKDAADSFNAPLSRINVLIENPQDQSIFAKELALKHGVSIYYSTGQKIYEAVVGSLFEERGSFIFIPWLIVILNVVVTMLNSIFEYRKEIKTLSAVGLSPSDIIELFIAEAAVIGIAGGGIGYLLGIGNYKLMSMLSIIVEVRFKVSAVWSFASILLSVSTVLVGAFVALRYSIVITPSMLRRWKVGTSPPIGKPWTFSIPFRVREKELASLFDHVVTKFRNYIINEGIDEKTGEIKYFSKETDEANIRTIHFKYFLGSALARFFPFQLVATKNKNEDTYSFDVICKGGEENVKETVNFIRRSIMEWSAIQMRN